MHALIIGDHRLVADLLKRDLVAIGYDAVDIAVDDEQAIRAAQLACPDLILVDDRHSAGMAIEAIRTICEGREIPVVYVTGNAQNVKNRLPSAVTVSSFGTSVLRTAIAKANSDHEGGGINVETLAIFSPKS